MKFLPLVWRNLLRRKIRTTLTLLAIFVCFVLFGLLMVLRVAFSAGIDLAGVDRLMMTHKTTIMMPLPISYYDRIRSMPGVTLASHASWFGGIYQDPSTNVFQFAVEPESYMKMYPEFKLPPDQMKAWLTDRQGCIVGEDLAKRFGWKIGDKIPILGTFNRPKGGDGRTWEFNIAGIYGGEKGTDKTQFLFRYDYLDENRRGGQGLTGWYMIKIADPARSADIAGQIDAQFANSEYETKTSTEKAMMQSFANQVGDIGYIMTLVATVVLFVILVITATQMGLAIRERTNEIGALKAMGFPDGLIMGLVLGESLVLTVVGGGLGLALAWAGTLGGDPTGGFLPVFILRPIDAAIGGGLAVLLGLLAGAMPANTAMRLRIVDALRRT